MKFNNYFEKIQQYAIKNNLLHFDLARRKYSNLAGSIEDGAEWFDLRMEMFHEWCLMDRKGDNGITAAETYLADHFEELDDEDRLQFEFFTNSMRSTFEILEIKNNRLKLYDLIRQGIWQAVSMVQTIGLTTSDIFNARLIFFGKELSVCKTLVLHPENSREMIKTIISRARKENMPDDILVHSLDKMKLKMDKYSNIHLSHVYKYPDDAIL